MQMLFQAVFISQIKYLFLSSWMRPAVGEPDPSSLRRNRGSGALGFGPPSGALTHWVLVLGGGRPAHGEGVGVDVADLSLGLRLGLALRLGLWGRRPDLGHVASVRPVLLTVDPRCPVHHGHAVGANQPLEYKGFFFPPPEIERMSERGRQCGALWMVLRWWDSLGLQQ